MMYSATQQAQIPLSPTADHQMAERITLKPSTAQALADGVAAKLSVTHNHHHKHNSSPESSRTVLTESSLISAIPEDESVGNEMTVYLEGDDRSVTSEPSLPSAALVPFSHRAERNSNRAKRTKNSVAVGLIGGTAGLLLGGPVGAVAVGVGGAVISNKVGQVKERRQLRRRLNEKRVELSRAYASYLQEAAAVSKRSVQA